MDRRSILWMAGVAALGAALPTGQANASPGPLPAQPPPPDAAAPGPLLFSDEFDGPRGALPDPGKWIVQNWDDPVNPPLLAHYRADPRNVFLDGNSNLVLCATHDGPNFFSGKVLSTWRGMINTTWEARIKLDCLSPGNWPAFWLLNQDPLPDGEVDVMEWYGNGQWPPGTTVHAASNGKTWKGKSIPELVDNGWHNWRVHWGPEGFQFWRDYVDGAKPYFTVNSDAIEVSGRPGDMRWPFGIPGYWMQAIFNLGVGGSGGGNPDAGVFPSAMLIDWIRVW
jgi:hypothetical protein